MIGEMDIGGLFAPTLLIWGLLGVALSVPIRRLLGWAGFYRFVWHRGLFDIALVILLWAAVAAVAVHLTFPA